MNASKGTARDRPQAAPTGGKGNGARSDTAKVNVSVLGSVLTVGVALAALILTSDHHTREQFQDQIELTRQHFAEQLGLTRTHFAEQLALTRTHFDSQIEQARAHSDSQLEQVRLYFDSQLGQVRVDLRDVRSDVQDLRNDLREVRSDVRALAERQARVEGLLLAVHQPEAGAPSPAGGANLSPSHPEYTASE